MVLALFMEETLRLRKFSACSGHLAWWGSCWDSNPGLSDSTVMFLPNFMLSLLFEVKELGINSFPSTRLLMKNAEHKARMGEGAAVAIPFDVHYNE